MRVVHQPGGGNEGRTAVTQELRQDIVRRVDAVQRRYHDGGRVLRGVWLLLATFVLIAGLAMLVLPGPAILVIPVGLAMLAVRYRWARSTLETMIDHGVRLHRRFNARSHGRVAPTVVMVAALAALVLLVVR